MSGLILERFVGIESEEDIDGLEHQDVVSDRTRSKIVFDRRENNTFVFYYPHILKPGKNVIVELRTPRSNIGIANHGIYFISNKYCERKEMTVTDGDSYERRREDLIGLGLMKPYD